MKFHRTALVRFEHCDAAGLMFYPRFYALVNEMVEDWFAVLDHPFADLHLRQRKGVPTVKLDAEFLRPVRMGERLDQTLHIAHLGHSSCRLTHEAHVNNAPVARVRPQPGQAKPVRPRNGHNGGPPLRAGSHAATAMAAAGMPSSSGSKRALRRSDGVSAMTR